MLLHILLFSLLFLMVLTCVTICTYFQDLHELFSPLTDEEEDEVSHAFYSGNRYTHVLQLSMHLSIYSCVCVRVISQMAH